AARLHEAVAEPDVAEFRRAPQQQVLDEPAEAGEQHGCRRRAFEQIVDRRDTAVRVAGRATEAEQVGGELTVDGKTGAGDCAGPERVTVGALVGRLQPRGIAFELFDYGKHVVRDGGRLRPLRVRVNGEDRVAVAI